MRIAHPARALGACAAFLFLLVAFAPAAKAQTNLIQNPGLESGTSAPTSWNKVYWGSPTPSFTYPAVGNGGTRAATVSLGGNSSGDARWQPTAVTVEAGATYTYSTWYNSNVASEIDVEYTGAGGALSWDWIADVPSSGGVWKQVSGILTVPSGISKASVFQLISAAGTLTIDDVSLTKNGGTIPAPPTLVFSATPTSITIGQQSTLSWSSTNATSCTASGGWSGTKTANGSETTSPSITTTYTLSCAGAGGVIEKQVTITVGATLPPAPTLTLAAAPASITSGQQSTLSWSSANVTSCTASGGWSGTKPVSGTQAVSPTANTTYTLNCTGPGGNVAKSTTVSVTASPPPGGFTQGMVSFTFDDSWLSQHTNALPRLQSAGFKGTFYLTTEPIIGGWSGFMTPTHVQDIAGKGHEIAGHTVTHAHLPQLSSSQITAEITNSKSYLQNLTGKSVVSLAYPYGESNGTVKSLAQQAGYTTGRGVEFESLNTAQSDKYDLKSWCIERNVTLAQVKVQIDKAKAQKQWFILCIHEVKTNGDQYSITPTRLQEIVNYVKQTGIKVVTVAEGRAMMSN